MQQDVVEASHVTHEAVEEQEGSAGEPDEEGAGSTARVRPGPDCANSGTLFRSVQRVEHVIREEKMIGAYDLIEIYSELIAARLPIIESQKNCPIDLKEAIASVIFASPRCADIPELLDVRKHFTAKYGKEFITAAIELRPNSGVSRMLVEKLSAVAPDGQTKMKVLNAIADEHNIKWEPKAFGEKDPKPPDDLLSGPNTFDKAGRPPKFEVPNVQAPANHDQQHDERPNLSEQSIRSSVGTQNFSSADTGGVEKVSATSHDMRHSVPDAYL
ncbi:hypothetical protein RJ639_042390 [Escallonia herrerae]|uniref:Vacuolar protein sorting-associated protein Ist1 n=1 Tax=Escallonia herrerae TaxID=1293975 RepID=A0AA88WFV4_9ASTE|nr:hypothetical protein RJ639_042390 [Escallonia herrerae]